MSKTAKDLAEELDLKSFDYAIPIQWVDKVNEVVYNCPNLSGQIVWCYDKFEDSGPNIFGYPVALTEKGRRVLGLLALRL